MDIGKVFNTISHLIFVWKWYALGIRGNIYDWVKSYVINIFQFILYNISKFETKFISQRCLEDLPFGS